MEKKSLILYIPVIHRGYLDFVESQKNRISNVYLIKEELVKELSEFEPDIACLKADEVRLLFNTLGIKNISILNESNTGSIKENIMMVNDEVSRNLYNKYLKNREVEWMSVFLRWDRSKILIERPLDDIRVSKDPFDIKMMKEALGESGKSTEWWRRIGAVLVKDKEIIIRTNNKDLPSDYTPYEFGEPRDFFGTGERHDIASTIHAEQKVIAEAAKKGIPLAGSPLYVTTFPCPVCAKIIACSGIKEVYFAEGGSNFDAKKVLESAGIKIIHVPLQ